MRHDHRHHHEPRPHDACCGGGGAPGDETASSSAGRSFRVAGLDCAEEVEILKKALGLRVGGEEHLAFDVLNGRMTVLESAGPVSDDAVIKAVAETGMSANTTAQGHGLTVSTRHRPA